MVKFSLIPREEKFFGLFEDSAHNMVKGAQALKKLIDTWEHVEAMVSEITELEHSGDSIAHQIIAQLHRSFITPFDREDIAMLAHTMDDIMDFIQAAADHMLIYKVSRPGQRAQELADVIVQAVIEVEKAVPKLRSKSHLKEVIPLCVEINRLENTADTVYRSALGELFYDSQDVFFIIKWREILEFMESATDRCEDVANVIEGVALKHG